MCSISGLKKELLGDLLELTAFARAGEMPEALTLGRDHVHHAVAPELFHEERNGRMNLKKAIWRGFWAWDFPREAFSRRFAGIKDRFLAPNWVRTAACGFSMTFMTSVSGIDPGPSGHSKSRGFPRNA
jgi:hypothetical protein